MVLLGIFNVANLCLCDSALFKFARRWLLVYLYLLKHFFIELFLKKEL
jgi:hypothetical protein